MGIKNFLATKAQRAGDKIARCSCLSTEQIEHIESRREEYYNKLQRYDPNDPSAVEITEKLKDDYRTVAKMNLIDNFGYKEIADALEMPINTVKTKIRRAKGLLCVLNLTCERRTQF